MSLVRSVLMRIIRLIVDDVPFALAIVTWLFGTSWLIGHTRNMAQAGAPLMFAGLACILLVGARRAAAVKRGQRKPPS